MGLRSGPPNPSVIRSIFGFQDFAIRDTCFQEKIHAPHRLGYSLVTIPRFWRSARSGLTKLELEKAEHERIIMEKDIIEEQIVNSPDGQEKSDSSTGTDAPANLTAKPNVPIWRVVISLILLFINYFLAQYDKFILSYFQDDVITSLKLSEASYGILSGYATGIVYALLALPAAYIADYTRARVWVLTISALWWSLCAIFQGLSHNFWQILLARIGMGIGQAPVEALSVSLISDLMGKEFVFFGERCASILKPPGDASKMPSASSMLESTSAKPYQGKLPSHSLAPTPPGTQP